MLHHAKSQGIGPMSVMLARHAAHTRVVETPLLEGKALVRSFACHRAANDKRCDKRTVLVTAVLRFVQLAEEGLYTGPSSYSTG